MSIFLERVISRSLPGQLVDSELLRPSSGMGNELYKVQTVADGQQNVHTVNVIIDSWNWWKLDQESAVQRIVDGDRRIGIPKVIEMGYDQVGCLKFAFIVKEFIDGQSLDQVLLLSLPETEDEVEFKNLISGLGEKLSVIHSHNSMVYGLVGRPDLPNHNRWGEYVLDEIDKNLKTLTKISPDKIIGSVSANNIIQVSGGLSEIIGSLQSSLDEKVSTVFSHGDAHFRNFISSDTEGDWEINGVIDTEEAVGGDPGIDLAFIENWLHFRDYKSRFYKHKKDFISGYGDTSAIAEKYQDRRLIYHILRSLTYLGAIFSFDINKLAKIDTLTPVYVNKHFEILNSLARGNKLEDLNIESILQK